jgi:hypothetical protein
LTFKEKQRLEEQNRAREVAQAVEHLPNKHEALCSTSNTTPPTKKEQKSWWWVTSFVHQKTTMPGASAPSETFPGRRLPLSPLHHDFWHILCAQLIFVE